MHGDNLPNTNGNKPERKSRFWRVFPVVFVSTVTLIIGLAIGIAGSHSKTVPGPAVTKTVPGPTVTVTVPGPTITKTVQPPQAGPVMPGDGTFAVGTASGDWAPGTWQTSGAAGGSTGDCYWATLSDLSGSESSIISNNNVTGPTILTISPGIAGVQVSGCNPWHKVG
jgi:hypothetical protein